MHSTFFILQLHDCVGSAIVAMGPEQLLSLIPLNLEAEDLSDANIWLFPILKQYIVGSRLNYFKEEVLTMIERVGEKARKVGIILVFMTCSINLLHSISFLLCTFCSWRNKV